MPLDATVPGGGDPLGDAYDHGSRQEGLAGVGGADGAHHLIDRPVLGEITVGTRLDGLQDGLVVGQGCQHHDPGGRPTGFDGAGGFGAGTVRQPVIHEDHIEALTSHRLGLGDGAGHTRDEDVRLAAQHLRQRPGQELVIVDEKDSDRSSLAVRFGHVPVVLSMAARPSMLVGVPGGRRNAF